MILVEIRGRWLTAVTETGTHERGNVAVEFASQPLGKTAPSPVPAWTGRWQNLCRLVGTRSHEHPKPLATGVSSLRAGIIDADVANKLYPQVPPQLSAFQLAYITRAQPLGNRPISVPGNPVE